MPNDKHAFIEKHKAMKMLAAKSADTYQEPIKHTSYDKRDKKTMVYSITKNQQTDSAAIAPGRPWNVWDIFVHRTNPSDLRGDQILRLSKGKGT